MFLVSGCQPNVKYLDCPAFDHLLAKQWQPVEAGNTVVFTRSDGNSAVYLLNSITLSKPYVAAIDINSSAEDGPNCTMTAKHVFSAEDGSHDIILEFTEQDNHESFW